MLCVTSSPRSRKDFVDAYLLYVFSDSVSEQYSAFSSGFLKVCGGEILALFQPCELMAMVVGNNNYNWEEMEKVSIQFQSYSTLVPQAVPTVPHEKYLVCFSRPCSGHVSLGVFIMKKKKSHCCIRMALRTNPQILGETGAGKVWTCSLAGKIDLSCANIWHVSQSTHSIIDRVHQPLGKKNLPRWYSVISFCVLCFSVFFFSTEHKEQSGLSEIFYQFMVIKQRWSCGHRKVGINIHVQLLRKSAV